MKHERYITPDGRVLFHAETQKHHTVWKKDWYNGQFERHQFREMGGFVLRLPIIPHKDLHANVEPPAKPNHNLMRGLWNHGKQLDIQDPYQRFEHFTELLLNIAESSGNNRNADDAWALHENFVLQSVFIEEGKLKPYYGE